MFSNTFSEIRNSLILILLIFYSGILSAQKDNYKLAAIGFYNLENLFDTDDDPKINDEEFLPDGKNAWTPDRYEEKLANMAYAISQIAIDQVQPGLSILGLAEIENRKVLEDLASHPLLKERNYQIVHFDSPDRRGVDVAMFYNPRHFKVKESQPVELIVYGETGKREYTRDILLVGGEFDGEELFIMVNHWPSRRGGESRSAYKRNKAASICRAISDSIYAIKPHAKVVIMGDLNDDPTSPSLTGHLRAKGKKSDVEAGGLFNPFYDFYRRGLGSNAYQDSWSLFDQIIISQNFLDEKQSGYKFLKANIFNKQFLVQQTGKYKGYPFRTFSFDNYQGGYSDHFPTYILVAKKI